MRLLSLLFLLSVFSSGCSSSPNDNGAFEVDRSSDEQIEEAELNEDSQAVEADALRGGETYEEYDTRRDEYGEMHGRFGSYGCTQDCSGHEAGYRWAESKGITDPDECGGKSWSFIEGCRAYAEEQ